jgi:hypothetical protein
MKCLYSQFFLKPQSVLHREERLFLYYKDQSHRRWQFFIKVSVIFVRFEKNQNVFADFSKNIKFHENPSGSSRVVHAARRTDIHDGSDTRFSQVASRTRPLYKHR